MPAREEILELEREFWTTMARGEHQKSAALLTPMAAMAGSMGTYRFSPDEYVKMSEKSPFTINDWAMSEEDVIFPNDETAICMYRVNQTVTNDGKTEKMDTLDTSVWVKDGDSWKCAMHTEVPNANPH